MNVNIQNGIILNGVVYELKVFDPDKTFDICEDCELHEKCHELMDETLCDICGRGADYNDVFRRVRDNSEEKKEIKFPDAAQFNGALEKAIELTRHRLLEYASKKYDIERGEIEKQVEQIAADIKVEFPKFRITGNEI